MPNWFIEEGIGETRAICIEGEEIVAAHVDWHGEISAGAIISATLIHKSAGSKRGTAQTATGEQILISRLPANITQGAQFLMEVTRAAIAERTRIKLAQGKFTEAQARPAPSLAQRLQALGHDVQIVRQFPTSDWPDLIAEAFSGEIPFSGVHGGGSCGGALQISPTAAMTLIDVDGEGSPYHLAKAAVPAIAAALRRLEIGGNIGIDFPSIQDKAQRREIDQALDEALNNWPHERTSMNGFGFVQIVARFEQPSLLHRAHFMASATAARLLLRRAEHLEGAGQIELRAHPAIEAHLRPEWREELSRRTGKNLCFIADPALAIEAPQAQSVSL